MRSGVNSSVRLPLPMWKLTGRPGVLRGGPERIPVRIGERREAELLRLAREQHAAVAARGAALDLARRRLGIPERRGAGSG